MLSALIFSGLHVIHLVLLQKQVLQSAATCFVGAQTYGGNKHKISIIKGVCTDLCFLMLSFANISCITSLGSIALENINKRL
jgi:hypothetical protein